MKKQITLTIPNPCNEKWQNFTKTDDGGGFCTNCCKTVVDFTTLSDERTIHFLQKNKSTHVCGRFRVDQLKQYEIHPSLQIMPGLGLLKVSFASIMLMLISKPVLSQTSKNAQTEVTVSARQVSFNSSENRAITVTGIVTSSDDGSALPGVNVVVKGTAKGTATDTDGKFELTNLSNNDVLVFSFIGFMTREYPLSKYSGKVDVIMELDMELEIEWMGEVAIAEVYEQPSVFQRLMTKLKSIF